MRLRHFDLPLCQSAGSRFLPWTIGGLLYLAIVALAVAAIADEALRLYGARATMVTVTMPSFQEGSRAEQEMAEAMDIVRKTRGVTSAVPVPPEEVAALVKPWLGDVEADIVDLPLPRLIDVTLDPHTEADLPALEQRLRRVVEGATVGAEASSRDRAELAAFLRAWGSAAGVVVLLVMLALVGLITRISLRIHAGSVELLRSMGATDGYLARQFERHALLSSLQGGLVGLVLALLTVLGILYSSYRMQVADAIELHVPPSDWLLLACVPAVAALLITAVARITARWGLTEMR